MKTIIVGSGSATPDPNRGNPSIAVIVDDDILVFDLGHQATSNLTKAGINPVNVDHLFFSHLHMDHVADFNYLWYTTLLCGREDTLNIYGPPGTEEMKDHMLKSHQVPVDYIRTFVNQLPSHIDEKPSVELDMDVSLLNEGLVLQTDSYTVTAREVNHLNLLDSERFAQSSWAFRVDSPNGSVVYSGDTEKCDSLIELASGANLLVHEASFPHEVIQDREMNGHSSPRDAGEVAQEANVNKLVLTHLGPYDSYPAAKEMVSLFYDMDSGHEIFSHYLYEAKERFDGDVILGHDTLEIDLSA